MLSQTIALLSCCVTHPVGQSCGGVAWPADSRATVKPWTGVQRAGTGRTSAGHGRLGTGHWRHWARNPAPLGWQGPAETETVRERIGEKKSRVGEEHEREDRGKMPGTRPSNRYGAGVWAFGTLIRKSWQRKSEQDRENNIQKANGWVVRQDVRPLNRDAVILEHAKQRKRVG